MQPVTRPHASDLPALMDVADVAPDHCWVKFDDSPKADFIIGEKPQD